MKLIRIQTGKVRIKKNQITRKKGGIPSMLNVILGKAWSEWLPIYAWVIVHEEGIIVVDTGETSKTGIKNYLPKWHPYYALAVEFNVAPEDEIGPQLLKMGINPSTDVSKVILTHLHTDHAGGLHHFPNADILIEKNEFYHASGFKGVLRGYLPHRWPEWLDPILVELPKHTYGSFDRSLPITSDRKVMLVATPGHVGHHLSVIVEIDGLYYFLAGDTSYNLENLIDEVPDGVGTIVSQETLRKIKAFSTLHPTIYLPSHDPQVPDRINNKDTISSYYELHEIDYLSLRKIKNLNANANANANANENSYKHSLGYWETMAINK